MANDRLHEIMGEVGVLHNHVLQKGLLDNVDYLQDYVEERDYDSDVKEHYYKMLLQHYFSLNDLENCQKLLLQGIKFDMKFEDVKDAFCNIKDDSKNVIEFFDENVVFLKDNSIAKPLKEIHDYYKSNPQLQEFLEQPLNLLRKNRYVCSFAYNYRDLGFTELFIDEEILSSLKKDLPHLFKN